MFDNIGGKMKGLAVIICCIGIAASVIFGLSLMSNDVPLAGVIVIVAGSLSSWIGSFALYGFGQLVENSDTMVRLLRQNQPGQNAGHQWRCSKCGNMISDFPCPYCGSNETNGNLL